MWFLRNSAGDRIYLKPNKELTFGRKKTDIILQNDESISRLHASIIIEPKEIMQINELISICKLKDTGSKYGTYILYGDKTVEVTKEGYNLKDGDKIRFGLQQHIFTITYVPIITAVSTLNDNDKTQLQSLMDQIDGMISTDWINTCTHLTVSKATLTEKVTWAMASAVPVVRLNYWEEVKCAFETGKELPPISKFVPLISEGFVNTEKVSLGPNEKRKTLLKNLIFVHFSARQYKVYGKMINMAGGKSLLYSKKPLTNKELVARNVIVVQYSGTDATQSTQCIVPEYESIYKTLQTGKRRMISESEIPLAILYCSVSNYCNPDFKFGDLLKRTKAKQDSSDVLALDTQDVSQDVRILPKVISNVPVKANLNIKLSQNKVNIIPESSDTIGSIDLMEYARGFQEGSLPKGVTDFIPETIETYTSIPLSIEKTVQNKQIKIPEKTTKYIPETIDSFNTSGSISKEDTPSSITKASNVIEQKSKTKDIEQLKVSTLVNKRYVFKETIERSVEDHCELKENRMVVTEPNKKSNKISMQKETEILTTVKEVEKLTKVKEKRKLTNVQKQEEAPKIRNVIDISLEVLQEDLDLPGKRKTEELDGNPKKSLKMEFQTRGENKEKGVKTHKSSYESDNDEGFIPCNRKRFCFEDSETDDSFKATPVTSSTRNDVEKDFTSSLTRNTSSFLRLNPGHKIFQKVYKMVPTKRITLSNMYVWDGRNQQNF